MSINSRDLPVELYGHIAQNLVSSPSTLFSLLLTSRSVSAEARRVLYDHVTLFLNGSSSNEAYQRFISSLPTHPSALLIRMLQLHNVRLSSTSETSLNAALRATCKLRVLLLGDSQMTEFDMGKVMQSVEFSLERLQCSNWIIGERAIVLLSSTFASEIVDLRVCRITFRPRDETLPRLQTLEVCHPTGPALELASKRKVRRFRVTSMYSVLECRWDTFNLTSIESISVQNVSIEDISCPNLQYARVTDLPDHTLLFHLPYLKHIVANKPQSLENDSDTDDEDIGLSGLALLRQPATTDPNLARVQHLFESFPQLRTVDLNIDQSPPLRQWCWRYSLSQPREESGPLQITREVEKIEMDHDLWRTFV